MMANAEICNSPLPHSFPASKPSSQDHGPVSEFEYYNLPYKPHTEFPSTDLNLTESSEDSIPLKQPKPFISHVQHFLQPDPLLCLTPDKPLASKKKYTKGTRSDILPQKQRHQPEKPVCLKPDPLLSVTPEKSIPAKNYKPQLSKIKNKLKVHFESPPGRSSVNVNKEQRSWVSSSPSKSYSPLNYSDSIETTKQHDILANSDKPPMAKVVRHVERITGAITDIQPSSFTRTASKTDGGKNSAKYPASGTLPKELYSSFDSVQIEGHKPVASKPIPTVKENPAHDPAAGSAIPKRKVYVKKESHEQAKHQGYNVPFDYTDFDEDEHIFARPEFNFTLKMREKLDALKSSDVDELKALQKTLGGSDAVKTSIIEKASKKVNVGETFSGLVDLDVPVGSVKSHVESQKAAQTKSSFASRIVTKQKVTADNEPDLMEFFPERLQKETADFSLPHSLRKVTSDKLSIASHETAFDLYRHNSVWNKPKGRWKLLPHSHTCR